MNNIYECEPHPHAQAIDSKSPAPSRGHLKKLALHLLFNSFLSLFFSFQTSQIPVYGSF